MKRVIFIITFVFCCLLPSAGVYAGDLNEYELQVIAEAKKVYVYQGKEYRVLSKYIDQLTSYLSQDDVDITAEQRDKALQTAYDSIEQGVLEGYLVPVEEQKPEREAETELTTPEQSSTAKEEPSQAPLPELTPKVANREDAEDIVSVKPEEIEKLFEVIPERETEKLANQDVVSDESIITETGFSMNHTLYVIVGIFIFMILGFIATIRLDYFAQSDE